MTRVRLLFFRAGVADQCPSGVNVHSRMMASFYHNNFRLGIFCFIPLKGVLKKIPHSYENPLTQKSAGVFHFREAGNDLSDFMKNGQVKPAKVVGKKCTGGRG